MCKSVPVDFELESTSTEGHKTTDTNNSDNRFLSFFSRQVPEGLCRSVPGDFELVGTRKGFKRFTNAGLKAVLAQQAEAQAAVEAVLSTNLQVHRAARYW